MYLSELRLGLNYILTEKTLIFRTLEKEKRKTICYISRDRGNVSKNNE